MNKIRLFVAGAAWTVLAIGICQSNVWAADAAIKNPAPTAKDYTALGKLPDWSGAWIPDIRDQDRQRKTNPTPWTAAAQKKIDQQLADEGAGKPHLIFHSCLPENHPSFMLIGHNALEVMFTPGRVTIIGESDMNRLRRIYTDGRTHPPKDEIVDSFQGYSVGKWEGDTLVVDTIGIFPQAPIAISESLGIPNNGDMRVTERIHLVGPNTLAFELEITAPNVLTKPWKTTRLWNCRRERSLEIVEGVCPAGEFAPAVNADGDHVWEKFQIDALGAVSPPGTAVKK